MSQLISVSYLSSVQLNFIVQKKKQTLQKIYLFVTVFAYIKKLVILRYSIGHNELCTMNGTFLQCRRSKAENWSVQ